MTDWLDRTGLLLGEDNVRLLANSHVLILGVGGVGGYAAEMLVRAGVGEITIADGDTVELTNLNRQIIALHSTLQQPKTEALGKRLLDINPELKLHCRQSFVEGGRIDELLNSAEFDYAIDAIDTVTPKVRFILQCMEREIPIVSSMGSGGRTDPAKVEIADIGKTYNCGLAKAVRKQLRDLGVSAGLKTVFSSELVKPEAVRESEDRRHRSAVGTISYLPAVFGCFLASVVLRNLTASSLDSNSPAN